MKKGDVAQTPETAPVEAWGERKGLTPPVLAGVMAAYDWAPGKSMTEEEFDRAASAWRGAPMGKGVARSD